MNNMPQDFWLRQLGEASRFNQWVFRSLGPLPRGAILEIGCGHGNFTAMLARLGHPVTAMDINPHYVEIARRQTAGIGEVEVICGDATRVDWESRFAAVLLLDVLEHVEDDVGLLQRLRNALVPGGLLVLKVPAGRWLYGSMDRAIGHHRRYSRETLSQVCEAAGYSSPELHSFNAASIPGWWLNGRLLQRSTPPAAQVRVFERLISLAQLVDRLTPMPIGLSLIARAAAPRLTTEGPQHGLRHRTIRLGTHSNPLTRGGGECES
jgi:SAM-dependent methyltransferase